MILQLTLSFLTISTLQLAATSRFSRNEARCAVLCSTREDEECRICQTRIPMRFGKRAHMKDSTLVDGKIFDDEKVFDHPHPLLNDERRPLSKVLDDDGKDFDERNSLTNVLGSFVKKPSFLYNLETVPKPDVHILALIEPEETNSGYTTN